MNFAEQLKSGIDIVEVVGQYVRLKKAGPRWMGLCPFHTEKTPSFTVHATLGFYKCFGCGAGGDVIKFVMEIESLTFMEAMRALAERAGIPMPRRAEYSDPDTKLRAALFRMHEIALNVYRAALESGAGSEARGYLAKRAVTPALSEQFQLGLAANSGQTLVRAFEKEGFEAAQMEESGLVLKREDGPGWFDRFRNRLMFPIHDQSGRIIAFGGRALAADQTPKYINSSNTKIYEKSKILYNLHRAKNGMRRSDRAVLVEGYMDVIGVTSAGVTEVVAPCGTALDAGQVRSLRGHTERVVVNFDPDEAGASATERKLQTLIEEGMRIRVLHLEGGLDPDEFVKEHGAERYRECLDKAPGYFHWLADRARARFDMRSAEGRIEALKFLLPAVQRVSDRLERATVANDLATYLGIDAGLILDHFKRAATERREKPLVIAAGVKPIESILVNAFVASEEARVELLPALRALQATEQFATRRILQALFAMTDAGTAFSFGELEARLEEPERELLHKVVFSDTEAQEPEKLFVLAAESLRTLERAGLEARRAELKSRARDAERAGNIAEALRITKQLDALDKETNAHAQGRD